MTVLADLLSWIDSKKRIAGDRVSTLLSDPATMGTRMASDVEEQYRPLVDAARQGDYKGMVNSGLLSPLQTVWHGSPHLFDKFDASKIGTGEGAQAYGHGLYFADAPDVARFYGDTLGAAKTIGTKTRPIGSIIPKAETETVNDLNRAYASATESPGSSPFSNLIDFYNRRAKFENGYYGEKAKVGYEAALRSLRESGKGGHLYKVDLPDEMIPKMLDWDKPLSEQSPAVREILAKHGLKTDKLPFGVSLVGGAGDSGASIYKYLATKGGKYSEEEAAETMKKIGIPGIRYLDAGSRGAGKGTYNYVVFPGNEDLLKILERQ